MATTGVISQVIGSTFDAEFPEDQLPGIYNAVTVNEERAGIKIHLTGEVQQHLGGGRCARWPWARPTGWPAGWTWWTRARR